MCEQILVGLVCSRAGCVTPEAVEIAIGDLTTQMATYGAERVDTQDVCGDTANGFGLLFNWNRLGDGEHTVVARVTTLGAEFLRGVAGECMVDGFPPPGETVTLEWQQNKQNFVITAVE